MAGTLSDYIQAARLGTRIDIHPVLTVGTEQSTNSKARVEYLCTGTDDNVIIQQALNAINTLGGGTLFIKAGTYNLKTTLTVGSNTTIIGEDTAATVLKKVAGQNTSVLSNKTTSTGNSFIAIRNLTIDQNGANQTAGGGISMVGLTDSLFENLVIKKSYVFNTFIGSVTGTLLSGTVTVTNGSSTVTGSSTAFTTQLAVGSIIKTAGGRFGRVHSIASDTSLVLDRAWGHSTESGVTARSVTANARNRILNCTFQGTVDDSDNVGLGLFDDSLIQGCVSYGADDGYGFGPDHCHKLKLIGNTAYGNGNAGIGLETCGYCVVEGNVLRNNVGNGVYLLSGAYRNIIANNQCYANDTGINISYQNTGFPTPDENQVTANICERNAVHGIRVGGAARTLVMGNRCANNDQNGIVTVTDNSVVPLRTSIVNNQCYDNQDAKTQDRGIYVLNGTNTLVTGNMSFTADHTTAGITDSGTTSSLANNFTE